MKINFENFMEEAKTVEKTLRITGDARTETIIDIEDASDPDQMNPRLFSRTINDKDGLSVLKRKYNDRGDLSLETYKSDSKSEKSYEKAISYNYGTALYRKSSVTNDSDSIVINEETFQRDTYINHDGTKETIIERYWCDLHNGITDGDFPNVRLIENHYDNQHKLLMTKNDEGAREIYKYDDSGRLIYTAYLQDNLVIKEEEISYVNDGAKRYKTTYYVNGKVNNIHEYLYDKNDYELEHTYHGNVIAGIFNSHRHLINAYDENYSLIYMSDECDDDHIITHRTNYDGGYVWHTTRNGKLIKFEKEITIDYLTIHLSCNISDESIEIYLEEEFDQDEYELIPNKINIFYEGTVDMSHYDEIISEDVEFDTVKKYLAPTSYCDVVIDSAGVRTCINHFGDYSSIRKTYPPVGNERRVEIFSKYPVPKGIEDKEISFGENLINAANTIQNIFSSERIAEAIDNLEEKTTRNGVNPTIGSMHDDIEESFSNLFFE